MRGKGFAESAKTRKGSQMSAKELIRKKELLAYVCLIFFLKGARLDN